MLYTSCLGLNEWQKYFFLSSVVCSFVEISQIRIYLMCSNIHLYLSVYCSTQNIRLYFMLYNYLALFTFIIQVILTHTLPFYVHQFLLYTLRISLPSSIERETEVPSASIFMCLLSLFHLTWQRNGVDDSFRCLMKHKHTPTIATLNFWLYSSIYMRWGWLGITFCFIHFIRIAICCKNSKHQNPSQIGIVRIRFIVCWTDFIVLKWKNKNEPLLYKQHISVKYQSLKLVF